MPTPTTPTTPTPQPALFSAGVDADTAPLIAAYQKAGRTLDDLPYTPEFESIYSEIARDGTPTRREVFHRLHTLRKAARLPRVGKAPSAPPRISEDDEDALIKLVCKAVEKLSHRDQLPFEPAFDDLVAKFNADTGRSLSPHDVWRIIAKIAK